jgi:phage host-nuclease inhibitor protein Gam
MKKDFIPAALGDLDTWEVNFKNKVTTIAQQLNVASEEVTDCIASLDVHRTTYASMVTKRNEARAATSTNNASEKTALKNIRALCNRMKAANGYTEAMGNELKIIGNFTTFDQANAKPTLTVGKEGSSIVIKFRKDNTSGVHIYCRRGTEKDFVFLAVDTASPYNDNRLNLVAAQSETREYKAWYFLDDSIIGQESDVVKVIV